MTTPRLCSYSPEYRASRLTRRHVVHGLAPGLSGRTAASAATMLPSDAERQSLRRGQSTCPFVFVLSDMSISSSCVSNLTSTLSMFNLPLCDLTGESKTGNGRSAGCWSAMAATTDRSGAARRWSGPPAATSPASGSATSSRGGSRSRASARWSQSAGRWACRSRSGRASLRSAGRTGLARHGGSAYGR